MKITLQASFHQCEFSNYPQDAQSVFEAIASDTCVDIDSDLDAPRVRLVKAGEEGVENFGTFAHAELDLSGPQGGNFPGGPMALEIDGKTFWKR